jgi:flagellar protein FlaG
MAAVSDEADLRLQIEEDQASGLYVYRTINRRTGEVVQQLPREDVLRLHDDAAYLAGGVIRTKA